MSRRLPKWPKRPKKSSGVAVWQRYLEKVKTVEKKRKEIKDAPRKKDTIAAQADKIKNKY